MTYRLHCLNLGIRIPTHTPRCPNLSYTVVVTTTPPAVTVRVVTSPGRENWHSLPERLLAGSGGPCTCDPSTWGAEMRGGYVQG